MILEEQGFETAMLHGYLVDICWVANPAKQDILVCDVWARDSSHTPPPPLRLRDLAGGLQQQYNHTASLAGNSR